MVKNEQLAKMQEQMSARKTLFERGKIRLIPETTDPRPRQKGEEADKNDWDDKQLPLIPARP
jgi:hypothetical protein